MLDDHVFLVLTQLFSVYFFDIDTKHRCTLADFCGCIFHFNFTRLMRFSALVLTQYLPKFLVTNSRTFPFLLQVTRCQGSLARLGGRVALACGCRSATARAAPTPVSASMGSCSGLAAGCRTSRCL